jgi:hypothetical protein
MPGAWVDRDGVRSRACGDQLSGDGEQAQHESFGSTVELAQREQLHPGGDLAGQCHNREVDLDLE